MIAKQINQTISMQDVANRYGIETNRAGFTACPFHSDKTASLKIYSDIGKGFYCFGCNRGGDVIKFVMLLFNINFVQAITRIKNDFFISDTSNDFDDSEYIKERNRNKKEREEQDKLILNCAKKIAQAKQIILKCEPMSDEWAKAINYKTYLEINFELMEFKKRKEVTI